MKQLITLIAVLSFGLVFGQACNGLTSLTYNGYTYDLVIAAVGGTLSSSDINWFFFKIFIYGFIILLIIIVAIKLLAKKYLKKDTSIDILKRWTCNPQYIPSNGEVKVLDNGETFIYSKEL